MLIDSIGKGLGLQADASMLVVDSTALSMHTIHVVGRVELHAWRSSQHLEAAPRLGVFELGCQLGPAQQVN